MPLKPGYLLLVGAGGIVVYSGIKGLGISSATRAVIAGSAPSTATPANQIQPASYGYGAQSFGGFAPGTTLSTAPGSTLTTGPGGKQTTVTGSQVNTTVTHTAKTLSTSAAKALGFAMVTAAGWGSQWSAFNSVVMAESGWDTTIHNGGGHGYVPGLAYGIPQALPGTKMASAGSDWLTSSYTQIKWMIGYIRSTYGDPNNAWAHEQRYHWY